MANAGNWKAKAAVEFGGEDFVLFEDISAREHQASHSASSSPLVGKNQANYCGEINVLSTYCHLEMFTEESVIAFDRWSERFIDYLKAIGKNLTEEEKLAHLRLSLGGIPRDIFRELSPAQTQTVEIALKAFRDKLNTPARRELARRTLSNCKQGDDETVSVFLRRLTPLVEMVNSGLTDAQMKDKLCEEFLDRISPKIGFMIKLVGVTQTKYFDLVKTQALELEALLATKSSGVSAANSQAVHALHSSKWMQDGEGPSSSTNTHQQNAQGTVRFNQELLRHVEENNPVPDQGGNWRNSRSRDCHQANHRHLRNREDTICDFCLEMGHFTHDCPNEERIYIDNEYDLDSYIYERTAYDNNGDNEEVQDLSNLAINQKNQNKNR
jgi:hypothetical protein